MYGCMVVWLLQFAVSVASMKTGNRFFEILHGTACFSSVSHTKKIYCYILYVLKKSLLPSQLIFQILGVYSGASCLKGFQKTLQNTNRMWTSHFFVFFITFCIEMSIRVEKTQKMTCQVIFLTFKTQIDIISFTVLFYSENRNKTVPQEGS